MNPQLWHSAPWLVWASLSLLPLGAAWMAVARGLPGLRRSPLLAASLTWLLTRVGLALVLWRVTGHGSSDYAAVFLPQARAALEGALPYRDFQSSYGPLFAPLLGLSVGVFGTLGPLVVFLLADLATWRVLAASEGEASDAAWAWVASPLVWFLGVRYAQDEPLAALMVALAWWALRRDRPVLTGLALGLGVVATKPLFLLLVVPFVLHRGRRAWRPLLAGAVLVTGVYVTFLARGAPVLQPLRLEGGQFGIGPTLWRVPVVLGGLDLGVFRWLPFAAVASIGAWWLRRRSADAAAQATWQFAAFAALGPKFMPMYAVIWLPLVAVWAAAQADRRAWLWVYGAILPLAGYLESGPLQGQLGGTAQIVAVAGLAAIALAGLWPLWLTVRSAMRDPARGAGRLAEE